MANENKRELVVSAIENGTVIDHIPAGEVYKVVKILNLDMYEDEVLIGTNLSSKKYGKKGIIKVKNKFFAETEVNKVALIAPNATLIIIKNYEVVEKRRLEIPDTIKQIVKCINPNCITNIEDNIETNFRVVDKEPLKLQCHYCEKTMSNIRFNE
ncbi:MAG: aspartate carbamoyltransferase regulatory subunit [Bacteroidales bacterium]|nr:aspartate carbamoyltransferase regulatory subunit [Bacteroidales bacterium]MBO7180359.1 aspartate carbamoyltransferase regulatory subunit [Bacteroidales bacterium]MBO7228593.1 aspartate carbamoyltransferase regulatory subunit [Bacteroidales bacterium]MBQ1192427.1 aspartate carbamoyltransferase regulatory subunit [Bacteroidales bacterium]MBQ2303119.1 aspartate carbamoyltransferase regulatory subunit [Bacteroidales bacterium]